VERLYTVIITNGLVVDHKSIAKNIFQLILHIPSSGIDISPGHFVQLSCPGKNTTLLKRPFSIFEASADSITILYKVVGRGTENLLETQVGESLDMILPCGNSFSPPVKNGWNVLIGGGLGMAPLHFLTNNYPESSFDFWVGTSYQEECIPLSLLSGHHIDLHHHADFVLSENNSLCFTENLLQKYQKESSKKPSKMYCCGPTKLMESVANYCQENHIPLEVSLESRMACGFGVCLGCSFLTTEGMKTVCKDGPVFDSSIVKWESLQ